MAKLAGASSWGAPSSTCILLHTLPFHPSSLLAAPAPRRCLAVCVPHALISSSRPAEPSTSALSSFASCHQGTTPPPLHAAGSVMASGLRQRSRGTGLCSGSPANASSVRVPVASSRSALRRIHGGGSGGGRLACWALPPALAALASITSAHLTTAAAAPFAAAAASSTAALAPAAGPVWWSAHLPALITSIGTRTCVCQFLLTVPCPLGHLCGVRSWAWAYAVGYGCESAFACKLGDQSF